MFPLAASHRETKKSGTVPPFVNFTVTRKSLTVRPQLGPAEEKPPVPATNGPAGKAAEAEAKKPGA